LSRSHSLRVIGLPLNPMESAKIHPETAHESFSAWREQAHDDLLLALALCTWWGETRGHLRGGVLPIRF